MKGLMFVALVLLAPRAVSGQFLDEFNGNALAPHWQQPPPSHWQYEVSGGMLRVLNVHFQWNPQTPYSTPLIAAFPPMPGNFEATARMGWDPPMSDGERRMTFGVVDGVGENLGSFGYADSATGGGFIFATIGPYFHSFYPAPLSGIHEFSMKRDGGTVLFFLDGSFLTALWAGGAPMSGARFSFSVTSVQPVMAPLYVDRVQVIPTPGTGGGLALVGAWAIRRRRRQ